MLTLAYLLTQLQPGATPPLGADRACITQACVDSRQACEGSLFVALPGERTDGHLYVAQALRAGALAALVRHPVEGVTTLDLSRPASWPEAMPTPLAVQVADPLAALQHLARCLRRDHPRLRVVGVTGSVGKTTAKEVLAAVLGVRYSVLKSEGNLNNEIGLPLTLLRLNPEHDVAVLEMGMYALGEIAFLCEIAQPQLGVVMNVEPVHLERLGSIERIAEAKAELVRALPSDGLAILNGDDPRARAMAALTSAPTLTFGLGEDNDVRATAVEPLGLGGIAFRARARAIPALGLAPQEAILGAHLLGRHAVMPALAALTVGLALGLTWDEMRRGLLALGPGLRLTPRRLPNGALLLDDSYNASPASSLAALDLLTSLGGRRIAILGDMLEMGEAEERGHREVGRRCADTVDRLVAVGRRARWIAQSAVEAGLAPAAVYAAPDNEAATAHLRVLVQPGDTLLIKGSRGMAMEQIVQALTAGMEPVDDSGEAAN